MTTLTPQWMPPKVRPGAKQRQRYFPASALPHAHLPGVCPRIYINAQLIPGMSTNDVHTRQLNCNLQRTLCTPALCGHLLHAMGDRGIGGQKAQSETEKWNTGTKIVNRETQYRYEKC